MRVQGSIGSNQRVREGLPISPGLGLAFLAFAVLTPTSAFAFRTAADNLGLAPGTRVVWESTPIEWTLSTEVPGLLYPAVETAMTQAIQSWSEPSCTSIRARFGGASGAPTPNDGRNTIGFIRHGWVDRGFSPDAIATTDIVYESRGDGYAIVEADIYLRAEDQLWHTSPMTIDGTWGVADVVRHEWGHVLGVAHPCEDVASADIPSCESDPSFADAIMHPHYLGPRDGGLLGRDDVDAICFLAPGTPPTCSPECPTDAVCDDGVCVTTVPACESDAACRLGSRCVDGQCIPSNGEFGDPCTADDECAGGVCEDSVCTSACDCGAGLLCDEATARCRAELGAFGETCSMGEDCILGLCLTDSALPGS
jgi:hypothetical protein